MGKAVRAIIFKDSQLLVMYRNKYGSEYYTLVGGQVQEGESLEQALIREVKEETGLTLTAGRMVFYEDHPEPYNQQYIYLCTVAPFQEEDVKIQDSSEEGFMNRVNINVHTPRWVNMGSFAHLQFRTPLLQQAIMQSYQQGFPTKAVQIG